MNIKNYTSSTPASVTVARIEELLASAGATNISKDYKAGRLVGISFVAPDPSTRDWHEFRVPVNVEAIFKLFTSHRKKRTGSTDETDLSQAERTAWKLMQEWIQIQFSLIQMRQAELLQVFMPYLWNGSRTMFEAMKATGFKALPAAGQTEAQ